MDELLAGPGGRSPRRSRLEPRSLVTGMRRAEATASAPGESQNPAHPRAPLGGLFRHVLDVAQGQAARGHRVGLIVDSITGGARANELLAQLAPKMALNIARVPIARQLGFGDIGALQFVAQRIASVEPDVVHGHGAKGAALARLAPRGETTDPRLHAARRIAGLCARHRGRRLLSRA